MNESATPVVVTATPPAKQGSQFLTLEYVAALGFSVLSALCSVAGISAAFGLWNDKFVAVGAPLSWLLPLSGGYAGIIVLAVAAVLSAALAYVFFGRVSRTVPQRAGYTNRISYKVATYGAFATFAVHLVVLVAALIGTLIASLVLIGSDSSISALYLQEFLPQLVGAAVIAAATYFTYRIVRGFNKSRILSLTLLGVAVAVLLTLIITVTIRSHDDDSRTSNDYSSSKSVKTPSLKAFDSLNW